jgi:hypothetical protein
VQRILVLFGLMAACAVGEAAPVSFQWGVNGHPNVQEGYRDVPVDVQLDLAAQMGARWYRCDWDQGRLEKEPAVYDELVAKAARRGIRILPVIFPSISCRSDAPPEQIRAAAAAFAKALAERYRGRITHWELDNELDGLAMIRKGEKDRKGAEWRWGDPDGDRPEHYEETRYRKAEAELRGLSEGIKAGNPQAKTIINTGGWLHTGFMERLVQEDRVPFDILGWHWYSEMGDMTKVRGTFDLLARLRSYGKPIWITEINRRGGSMGGKEEEQAAYLSGAARQLSALPGVEALFVYELLDEPYFGADNPESHYGLVGLAKGTDGRWRTGWQKMAFSTLRQIMTKGEGQKTTR